MKNSTSHYGALTRKGPKRAKILLVSLLVTAVVIAASFQTFAQNVPNKHSFEDVGALTRPKRNAEATSTRRVFVRSKSLLVRAAVVEDKLLKRPEFTQLGFVITREESDADLIFELRHDLLTKYVFSVVDAKTQTLLASGKVSSLGGTVAGKVAKRFVRDMARIGTP
jgi:hypothetical protein